MRRFYGRQRGGGDGFSHGVSSCDGGAGGKILGRHGGQKPQHGKQKQQAGTTVNDAGVILPDSPVHQTGDHQRNNQLKQGLQQFEGRAEHAVPAPGAQFFP